RFGDFAGDFVLDFEDVFHFAVIAFGPHREIGARVDQLRGDAKTVAGAAQAAGQNVSGTQLLANLLWRHLLVAERQNGRARVGVQSADFRELGDDVFGDAVAQVFIFFGAAEIFKVEDRDGFRTGFGGHAGTRVCCVFLLSL